MATHYESESVSHIAATYIKYHKVRSLNTVCNDLQLVLVDHRTIPQTLLQTYEIADAGQLCCGTYPILLAVGIGLCMQTDD